MGANNSVPVENSQDIINQKKIIMNQKKILERQKQQINLLMKQKEENTNNYVQNNQPEVSQVEQPNIQEQVVNEPIEYSQQNNTYNFNSNRGDRFLEDVNIRKNDYKPRIENSQQELYQKFIKEQDKVKDFFKKKQKERKDDFYNELKQFGDKHNPYKILCLKDDANLDEIKKNYRLLSKKYHPDKGGDVRKFQLITKAYTYLLNEHESFTYREQTYEELQESLSNFMNKQKLYQNKFIDKDNFSLNKFNEVFEKFKLEEENDGYGSMMNTNDRSREPETINIAKNSMFDRNFSVDIFNKVFNNEKDNNEQNKQLILYEEPQSIVSSLFNNASSLGNERIDDYTDKNYTDYKMAHSVHNNLINANNIKYRQYKNIDELKNERSNIDTEMTEEEKEKYYNRKNLEKERENIRLRNIREYDRRIETQFNTLNRMMIKDK